MRHGGGKEPVREEVEIRKGGGFTLFILAFR